MKNVYRLNSNWNDNTSEYDLVNLVENRKFISSTTKEVDITSQLNVVSLDSSMIQDASFYRYPKLTLPRTKVDILKEKFNISITRAEDKADYKIISDKYINSLCDMSWSNLYTVKDTLDFAMEKSNNFTAEALNSLKDILKDAEEDDLVEFNSNYWWGNSKITLGQFKDHVYGSYYYLKTQYISTFNDLLASSNIVSDTNLNDLIYEDLHVLTKEEYNNCRNMLKSNDLDNRALALEMLANCNLNKSFDYVSMLYYFYYDYMKDARNWNNVNVKTLRNALSNFSPMSNMSYGHFYNHYLQQLVKEDQLTEFAFKECARYVFHNVVKRHMGMTDESVFKIDIDAIQINPKYLDKLKSEHDFFLTDVENAVMKF